MTAGNLNAQAEPQASGGANNTEADSTKKARIEIINTDVFEFNTTDSNQVRQFTGNVHFRHKGTDFFCDKAVQFLDTEIVVASGHVHIQKPDSFDIWSNRLVYYSRTRLASFRGNVAFEDSTARLTTDTLDYDLETDIGYFRGGGQLANDSSILKSRTGTYYHLKREAVFRGDVHLTNPDFDLYSDSMLYDTRDKVAYFIAPTRIVNGEDVIIANSGYYDTRTNKAQFGGGMEMESGTTRIIADQLQYDKEMGYGEATGNVIWEDTSEQITIVANYAEYVDSLDYVMATDDPLLIDVNDDDTLYLSADTLVTMKLPWLKWQRTELPADSSLLSQDSVEILPVIDSVYAATGDSIRIFFAYEHAKMLNGRLAGVSDSLFFSEGDSIFRLHGDPLMWVDTTQFSGDSMHMALRNKELDRIFIYRNALIIHESASGIYDQTRGTLVTGIFLDGDLERMEIEGNGESIYFLQDDSSAYIGGNQTLCSRMVIYMQDSTNEVDHITFLTKPEATFTPFSQISLTTYKLEGFSWEIARKPNTVYDVVRYMPLYKFFLDKLAERATASLPDQSGIKGPDPETPEPAATGNGMPVEGPGVD